MEDGLSHLTNSAVPYTSKILLSSKKSQYYSNEELPILEVYLTKTWSQLTISVNKGT